MWRGEIEALGLVYAMLGWLAGWLAAQVSVLVSFIGRYRQGTP